MKESTSKREISRECMTAKHTKCIYVCDCLCHRVEGATPPSHEEWVEEKMKDFGDLCKLLVLKHETVDRFPRQWDFIKASLKEALSLGRKQGLEEAREKK